MVVTTALAALIVLGVLAVLILTVRGLQTSHSAAAMTVAVAEVTDAALATTSALQEERALGSIMTHDVSANRARYGEATTRTDQELQELRVAWSRHRTQVPTTATPPISDVLAIEVSLVDFREATTSSSGVSTFPLYTEAVGLSLAATQDLVKQNTAPGEGDRLIINALLTASESIHTQRNTIQAALAEGEPLSEEARLQVEVVTDNLRQSLFEARSLAEDTVRDAVEEIINGDVAQRFEQFQAAIFESDDVDHGVTTDEWFEAGSARSEQVDDLIPRIHAGVASAAYETLDRARRALWTRSILLGALFVLTILVAGTTVNATRERAEALAEYGQLTDGLRAWFLAASFPDPENVDIAARYVPASIWTMSGGDWYDVYEVGGDLAVVIGDVAGHGAEATAQMAQVRNILRGQSTARTLRPADQIDLLSRTVFESGIVATLTYGLLNPGTGVFTYTRAGHMPLLVRSAAGKVRIEEEAPGPPVGAGIDVDRKEKTTRLEPGDTLVLITDGLVEAIDRDIDLALDQIAATVRQTGLTSETLLDQLFALNAETPIDDAAALIITWKGRESPLPV